MIVAYPQHPYTYCWDLYNPEAIIQRYPLSSSSMSQKYDIHICMLTNDKEKTVWCVFEGSKRFERGKMSDNELTPFSIIHFPSCLQNTHSPLYFRLDPSIFKLVRRLQMVFAFVFLLATKPDDEKKRRKRGNWFGIEGKGFERLRVLPLSCWHRIDVCEGFFKMKEWERRNAVCSMNKEWISDKERMKGNRDEETPPKLFFSLPRYHTISERTPQRYCTVAKVYTGLCSSDSVNILFDI